MNLHLRWVALFAACFAGAALAATTTGSGRSQTETRAVVGFDAIVLSDAMRLVVRQGSQESVQVQADDNLLPLVETVVETRGNERVLQVRFRRGERLQHKGSITVTVDAIRINALSTMGSGTIEAGPLNTSALRLNIAGSGDTTVRGLTTGTLDVNIAGSGDVRAAGRAGSVKLSIAGSGDADLAEVTADDVKVSIAGSGDADVTADRSLAVSIVGSGDVRYGGAVATVKRSIVGSGDVKRR